MYGTVTPIVPATLWDVPTGDPIKDLSSAANTIIANSGLVPDTVVFGSGCALGVLEQRERPRAVEQIAFRRWRNLADRSARGRHGAIHRHALPPYVRLFGYAETYEDEATNALKPMVDPKLVLLGCSKSPALTSYGSVTQVEQDGETRSYSDLKFVPRKLATPKEDRTELRIVSRPCLIPYDLASWAVIKPLAGALQTLRKRREEKGRLGEMGS